MAPRDKGRQRIEPGFGSGRDSSDDMRADPEDRPVAKRKSAVRKVSKSKRSSSRRGKKRQWIYWVGAPRSLLVVCFMHLGWNRSDSHGSLFRRQDAPDDDMDHS